MEHRERETIIIAFSKDEDCVGMVERLVAEGHEVVGPVSTAGMALALAAVTPATLAVVGAKLDGRRDGRRLAECLEANWGVPSVLIGKDGDARSSEPA